MRLKVNRIVKETKTEGFGQRYCIWTQGCSIRCNGCGNKHMWSFSGGEDICADQIIEDIIAMNTIEGITMLGGEPFDQPEPLAEIVEQIKKANLSVIIFTGYQYEKLKERRNPAIKKILHNTDILIDGEYKSDLRDFSRPWIGSSNQRYIFLSDVYTEEDIKKQDVRQKFELRISKDGKVQLNGMGDVERFYKFLTCYNSRRNE